MKLDVTFHKYLMHILVDLEKEQKLASIGVEQRFSNCGPRTTSGPRVLPLWSF